MLKIIELLNLSPKAFKANNNKVVEANCSRTNKTVVNLSNKSKNNESKNLTYMPNIKAIKKSNFPIFNAKKILNYLMYVLIKILIF